ncbi:hypothetical protein D5125_14655 [Magnetovirga frankeli]|uniref:hypothetical protein n=1 Tax=Magnetovirga frankeli TaxID=947516 RepID=UPI0012941580|nr:hypothetical protein D5125_14655 [gamma proteobacterium SS-5]
MKVAQRSFATPARQYLDSPNPERRLKYADFIDIYTALDDNELKRYQQDYSEKSFAMTAFMNKKF